MCVCLGWGQDTLSAACLVPLLGALAVDAVRSELSWLRVHILVSSENSTALAALALWAVLEQDARG